MNDTEQKVSRETIGSMVRPVVCYWIKNAESSVLMVIGITAFIVFYNGLFGQMTHYKMVEMMVFTSFIVGAFMTINFSMTSAAHYLPMALSFGSTRRRAIAGQQIGLMLLCLQIYLIYMILSLAGQRMTGIKSFQVPVLLCAGILLICAGLGQILAVVSKKAGMKAAAAFVILMMVVLMGVAMGFVIVTKGNLVDLRHVKAGIQALVLFLGIILYLTGMKVITGYVSKMAVN